MVRQESKFGKSELKSERLRIGVDLDEVLAPFLSKFLEFLRDKYGITPKLQDFTTYAWFDTLGESVNETVKKIKSFRETPHFQEMAPVEGALDALKKLAKMSDLFVITARLPEFEEDSVAWLERHFNSLFLAVCFADNAYKGQQNRPTKAKIIEDLGIQILIEDDLSYAAQAVQQGVVVFLIDKPWNQGELPQGIERVQKLEDIVQKLS